MDELIDQVQAEYDAVPYESHAFPQSAPGQIAAVAHLFGLDTPKVSNARVLEIGCSSGGNLIPFAAWHPDAHVVGIDLSPVQIQQGRELSDALGLTNLELIQGDISRFDRDTLGEFDFIVCHGVYSWVPDSVQEAILKAFRSMLAPTGVAYISYNVYPGWKAKEIVRDAMLLRGGGLGTPEEKLSYARGMIDFLEEVAPADSVLAKALSDYRVANANVGDYYLMHEYLEAFNSPCYFLEMVTQAGENELVYLGDTMPSSMFANNYGEKVAGPLLKECGHSQVLVEQYLDFVVNRGFRQSLFVPTERASEIRYNLDRTRYADLHFAASVPAAEEVRLDDSTQEFGQDSGSLVTKDPRVKVAIEVLNERWPWTVSYPDLLAESGRRLAAAGVADTDYEGPINDLLDYLIVRGLTRVRLEPVHPDPSSGTLRLNESLRRMPDVTAAVGKPYVFNIWHETVPLSDADRYLIPMLDGTRDRDALVGALLPLIQQGAIKFERDGGAVTDESDIRAALAEFVDSAPERLEQMKLVRQGG